MPHTTTPDSTATIEITASPSDRSRSTNLASAGVGKAASTIFRIGEMSFGSSRRIIISLRRMVIKLKLTACPDEKRLQRKYPPRVVHAKVKTRTATAIRPKTAIPVRTAALLSGTVAPIEEESVVATMWLRATEDPLHVAD